MSTNLKNKSGLNGIQTPDLRDAGYVLCQLRAGHAVDS